MDLHSDFMVLGAQRVEIPVAIILTISNVPVDKSLTARERAVECETDKSESGPPVRVSGAAAAPPAQLRLVIDSKISR